METSSRPASELDAHLGYWLRKVSNSVSGAFARALQANQTSVAEWVLLRRLLDRKQATAKELAGVLMMTPGAVSKVVDKLIAKGWLIARTKPEDQRVQLLSLTAAGRRIVPKLAALADQNDDRFFAPLNAAEKLSLRTLLIKLAEHHQLHHDPLE